MPGNLRLVPRLDGRGVGLAGQMVIGLLLPLLVLPVALVSRPIAFLWAIALGIVALAPVVGLARVGSGLLLLGFATVPFNDIHPVASLGWMELADPFFVLGFLLLVPHFAGRTVHLPNAFVVGALGILTVGTLSALTADQAGSNFAHLLDVVQGVILLPVLLTWWQPSKRTIIAAAAAYMVGNFVNVVASLIEGAGPSDRYDGLSSHPNILGYCQVLAFALSPFLFASVARRYHWIIGFLCIVSVFGVWISGSRAALLGVVAFTLLYPIFHRSIATAIAVGALGCVAVALVSRVADQLGPETALGRLLGAGSSTTSNEERREGARSGMEQFLSHPMLGDGWLTVWGAHNAYLQFAAAIGMFGLLAYLILLSSLLRPLVAVPSPYGLLAAPVLAAVMLDMVLPVIGARYVWCIVGLSLNAYRLAALDEQSSPSGPLDAPARVSPTRPTAVR